MSIAVESPDEHKHRTHRDLAGLLVGAASVIFALAFLLWVLWQIAPTTRATPFDSDGVRCYKSASEMVCLKTAEPAR